MVRSAADGTNPRTLPRDPRQAPLTACLAESETGAAGRLKMLPFVTLHFDLAGETNVELLGFHRNFYL